jgi:CheY-like chemotaxis protein
MQVLGMTTPVPSPRKNPDTRALRILLVEDHDGIARACQRLLVSHGHFVVRAAAAASALAAAEREAFDLLLCDLSLPDGSGLQLLPRLRSCLTQHNAERVVPAIAISGSVYRDDIDKCLSAGFAVHLPKPFDEEGLVAAIESVMQAVENDELNSRNGSVPAPVPARLR